MTRMTMIGLRGSQEQWEKKEKKEKKEKREKREKKEEREKREKREKRKEHECAVAGRGPCRHCGSQTALRATDTPLGEGAFVRVGVQSPLETYSRIYRLTALPWTKHEGGYIKRQGHSEDSGSIGVGQGGEEDHGHMYR
eukprot:767808-Hanusia_phi.AAC.1